MLAEVVNSWGLSPLMVVPSILLFYVVRGSVMDELSMTLLTIPIDLLSDRHGHGLWQLAGTTAIWFGIMALKTVGYWLPPLPVGLNVYVINARPKTCRSTRVKRVWCLS